MRTIQKVIFLAVHGLLAATAGSLLAGNFTTADITQIVNDVKTMDASGARPAKPNETIAGEQSVRTGSQSRAELTFIDKSLTRLGANTSFRFQRGTRELELEQGTILFNIPKGAGGARIRTAAVTAAITGTTGFYEYSPNAGAGGIIKFGILEGKASLSIKGRLGHIITVGPGEMLICTAKPRDFNTTEVVHFDIQKFTKSCPLITKMGGLAPTGQMLVEREVAQQKVQLEKTRELYSTNLVIPGSGTEVFVVSQLDQRFTTANPVTESGANPDQPTTPGASPENTQPSQPRGSLPTIKSPNPYVIKGGNTQVNTDPTIVTNGLIDYGALYGSAGLDGLLTNFLFGSTSPFDLTVFNNNGGPNADGSPAFTAGLASFKFSNLKIIGVPTFLTTGGSLEVGLVSEGTITSGAPGGVFNLDSLDFLGLATVNGSITLGPELSFTSTRTFIPSPNRNPELFVYARGATSDVVFGSNVNFADRQLDLTAERNVQIGSQITATSSSDPLTRLDSDVSIRAGNLFILDPTGKITASSVHITAQDVSGSSGALVDAVSLEVDLGNLANLTQSGGLLYVNSLPISQTNLKDVNIAADAGVMVTGNVTISTAPKPTSGFVGLYLHSDSGDVVINGNLTTNYDLQIETDHNFIVGPGGLVAAQNVDIHSQNGGITLPNDVTVSTAPNPSGSGSFIGLRIDGNGGSNDIIPGDVTVNGHLTTNYALEIDADRNFIMGPGSLITAQTVKISSQNAGLTLPGDVTVNTAPNPVGNANFIGLDLQADTGNVTVNGHLITNSALKIETGPNGVSAGNFVLGPSGRITAPEINIRDVLNVEGSGSAVVDGASALISINIQNAVTLTQSGNLVYVNSLPIDQTSPLQSLHISGDAGVNVPFDVNINTLTNNGYYDFALNSNGALTINGKLTSTKDINVKVQSLVVGPSAVLQAPNVYVNLTDTVNPATVAVSGNNLLFNSLPIDLSLANSYVSVSAPTIQVAPNLNLPGSSGVGIGITNQVYDPITHAFTGFIADTVQVSGNITANNGGLNFGGNTTVAGNVDAGGLGIGGALTVGGTVSVGGNILWAGQYSYYNSTAPAGTMVTTASSLTAPVVTANGIDFSGANEGPGQGSNNGFPDDGHVLTLNINSVVFDNSNTQIGQSSFNGGDALPANGKPGGNGGTFNVNATGDITVDTTISASSGVNATGVATGGNGGNVNLVSTGGTVTVNSSIDVSHNDVANRRVSASGGNIKLQSGKTTGTAISVTNSGNLRALLNAAAPGPGGKVEIVSAGGDILFNGTAQADRGTVDIRNNGPAGLVALTNATIAADVVKVGALGTNGILQIGGGSISANTQMKLYAGNGVGTNGTINFVDNVALNGAGSKVIAAKTINITNGKVVTINGATAAIHADNRNYNGAGQTSAGNGSFSGAGVPATSQPHSTAPAF